MNPNAQRKSQRGKEKQVPFYKRLWSDQNLEGCLWIHLECVEKEQPNWVNEEIDQVLGEFELSFNGGRQKSKQTPQKNGETKKKKQNNESEEEEKGFKT